MRKIMDKNEHVLRHKKLHDSLDELIADMITYGNLIPSKTTVLDLLKWSYKQCDISTIHHDIEYFQNILFNSLGVPKEYIKAKECIKVKILNKNRKLKYILQND